MAGCSPRGDHGGRLDPSDHPETGHFRRACCSVAREPTLKPRTRDHYRRLLRARILPTFRGVPLKAVTPDQIDDWHYRMGEAAPTARAHAYGLVRTILSDAVQRR
jgi:hypothetical protein